MVRIRGASIAGLHIRRGIAPLLVMIALTAPVNAQNLIANGSFTTLGGQTSTNWQVNSSQTLPSWTLTGDTTGYACVIENPNGTGNFSLTTVNPMCGSGYAAGGTSPAYSYGSLTQAIPALPVAYNGNVFIDDAYNSYSVGIAQTITGLLANTTYALSFYYTGAQQSGFSGTSQDYWQVSYGPSSGSTTSVCTTTSGACTSGLGITIPATSAPVWQQETIFFTTGTSQTSEYVNFLAQGNSPGNEPPFMLMADLSMTKVPEPASIILLGVGLAGIAGAARARRKGRSPIRQRTRA